MSAFAPMLIVAAVAVAAVATLALAGARAGVSGTPLEALPFQSGLRPSQHALSRYHARWYPLTLMFLAFDVEMLFMYPWTVVVASMGAGSVVEMFVFLGVLMVGVLWAWREGALRWV